MLVTDFLNGLRLELDDASLDNQLWSPLELAMYADEGINKFCLDTRCLKDTSTVGEVVASTAITLTGTAGQIDSVKVNSVTITGIAVPFNFDIDQTATDLAANITSKGLYSAVALAGGIVTVSALPNTGSNPNGYAIVTTSSGGDLIGIAPVMSGGTSICRLYFLPGVDTYALDPRIKSIDRIKPPLRQPMTKRDRSYMDTTYYGWEDRAAGNPLEFIEDKNSIQVSPPPLVAETVKLTVYRTTITTLVSNGVVNMGLDIELDREDMEGISYYCKYKAYGKQDAETLDKQKSVDNFDLYNAFVARKIVNLRKTRDVARPMSAHYGLT